MKFIYFSGVCSGIPKEEDFGIAVNMVVHPPHLTKGVKIVEDIRHMWEIFLNRNLMFEKALRIGISLSSYLHLWEGFLGMNLMCEKILRMVISLSGYVHL